MVGHSRGGHIVIHLAAMLKYRTHFMGLYDAVEKTTMKGDESRIIYNVDHIYHAVRDLSAGSRTSRKLNISSLFLTAPQGLYWLIMLLQKRLILGTQAPKVVMVANTCKRLLKHRMAV